MLKWLPICNVKAQQVQAHQHLLGYAPVSTAEGIKSLYMSFQQAAKLADVAGADIQEAAQTVQAPASNAVRDVHHRHGLVPVPVCNHSALRGTACLDLLTPEGPWG